MKSVHVGENGHGEGGGGEIKAEWSRGGRYPGERIEERRRPVVSPRNDLRARFAFPDPSRRNRVVDYLSYNEDRRHARRWSLTGITSRETRRQRGPRCPSARFAFVADFEGTVTTLEIVCTPPLRLLFNSLLLQFTQPLFVFLFFFFFIFYFQFPFLFLFFTGGYYIVLTFREVAFPQNLTEVGKSLNSEDEKEEI